MKDKEKISYYCFLVASVCFFICAVIGFFSEGSRGMAVTHLCLGAAFLCLASTHKIKEDKM